MHMFSELELREAARAIASTLMKSEKAILKLKEGSAQYQMTAQGIAAYHIALAFISRQGENAALGSYSEDELTQAMSVCTSVSTRVEKVLPKFAAGTPQHTLAVRIIRAFEIAQDLIRREQGV